MRIKATTAYVKKKKNSQLREEQLTHSSNLATIRHVWTVINNISASHGELKISFREEQCKQGGPTARNDPSYQGTELVDGSDVEAVGIGVREGEDWHTQLAPQPENQLSGQHVGVALALRGKKMECSDKMVFGIFPLLFAYFFSNCYFLRE